VVAGGSTTGEEAKMGTDADDFPLLELDVQLLPGALANGISNMVVLLSSGSSLHVSVACVESLAGAGLPGMVSSHNNDRKLLSASSSHFSLSSDFSTGVCSTGTAISTFSSSNTLSDFGSEIHSILGEELDSARTALASSGCPISYNEKFHSGKEQNVKTKLQ
jgi:hypothetical protein